jgi:hypothetical protein
MSETAEIQRVDHRRGSAYLPKLAPVPRADVAKEYREQVRGLDPAIRIEVGLAPITRADIVGVCDCGYVKLRRIPTPIPRALVSRYAGVVVPRKTDWVHCDACVNGYGFDMCGCGSGERFDKCRGGTEYCGAPMAIGNWSGEE